MATPTVQGDEIEVTPEMIEAGADIIYSYFSDVMSRGSGIGRETATEVYRAMQSLCHENKTRAKHLLQTATTKAPREASQKELPSSADVEGADAPPHQKPKSS